MPTPSLPRAKPSQACRTATIKILAQAIETAAGLFAAGTFRGRARG